MEASEENSTKEETTQEKPTEDKPTEDKSTEDKPTEDKPTEDKRPTTVWKSDGQPMSKNAQKKEARYQRMMAMRTEKRRDEKKRKRERKTANRLEREAKQAKHFETLTPEERAVAEAEALAIPRMLKSRARKERTRELMMLGPRVVIDMGFEEKMNSKEILSLSQQTRLCYGLNTRSEKPVHMMLTSVQPSSALLAHLSKNSGFQDWPLTVSPEPFISLADREHIVYLTAESEQVLESVEKDKVYCIGGIVDHNRFKSIAHDRAKALGLTTRRLPLESHLAEGLRKVITVNQVFHILLGFWEAGDWAKAVHAALPPRWQKGDNQEDNNQDNKHNNEDDEDDEDNDNNEDNEDNEDNQNNTGNTDNTESTGKTENTENTENTDTLADNSATSGT